MLGLRQLVACAWPINEEEKLPWFEHGASRVYYEDAGKGELVVLLPGFSDNISNHAALRDLLVTRYRVVAADLPGSGRSEPQPRTYDNGYLKDDAQSLCALITSLTDSQPHLIGFSDGGEVVLLIAGLFPEVPRSILVWGATGFVADPDGKIRATFNDVVDHPSPETEDYRHYLVETYGEQNARAMTQSFARAVTSIIEAGGDISRKTAGDIACPGLLIVGENDPFAPGVLAEEYAATMKRGEVIVVEGAGHAVHSDRPEWLGSTVMEWLSKH